MNGSNSHSCSNSGDKTKTQGSRAFSKDAAKKPEELGVPEKWLQIPGVKESSDGDYYVPK